MQRFSKGGILLGEVLSSFNFQLLFRIFNVYCGLQDDNDRSCQESFVAGEGWSEDW